MPSTYRVLCGTVDGHYAGVNAGGYFTLVEGRTRLAVITDSEATGLYFRGQSRVRKWLDVKFEYSWDKPNPDFYPDIASQSSLRLGVEFRHN